MLSSKLSGILGNMTGKRIAVIGDIILDRYIRGSVERISPEAPIPIVQAQETFVRLGGAANVMQNVIALGAPPSPSALSVTMTPGMK